MAEQPNEASRKSKAEGDRWSDEESQGGISNRPLDEEISNQDALPPRGEAKPGAHARRGGDRSDERSNER